ncbi:hypothetical protein D3C73_1573030 [compost metagenome]
MALYRGPVVRGQSISGKDVFEQRMMLTRQHDIAVLAQLIDTVGNFGIFVCVRFFGADAKLQRRFAGQVLNPAH